MPTTSKSDVIIASNGGILGPIEDTQTWATHFTGNSWSTLQDAIDAGYTYYAQPAQTADGYYEEEWDHGSTIGSGRITAEATWLALAGSPTVQTDISYKLNSGDGWTTSSNTAQIFVSNFRYVKVRVNLIAAAATDIAHLRRLVVRIDAHLRDDSGIAACASGDSGGTTVTFNESFFTVLSITATPMGTADRRAVVDFAGGANPTTFKVLVFDSAGTRVTSDVSWHARGNR